MVVDNYQQETLACISFIKKFTRCDLLTEDVIRKWPPIWHQLCLSNTLHDQVCCDLLSTLRPAIPHIPHAGELNGLQQVHGLSLNLL